MKAKNKKISNELPKACKILKYSIINAIDVINTHRIKYKSNEGLLKNPFIKTTN